MIRESTLVAPSGALLEVGNHAKSSAAMKVVDGVWTRTIDSAITSDELKKKAFDIFESVNGALVMEHSQGVAAEFEISVGDEYAGASIAASATGSISSGCSLRDMQCYITAEGEVFIGASAHAKAIAEGCVSRAGAISYAVCGRAEVYAYAEAQAQASGSATAGISSSGIYAEVLAEASASAEAGVHAQLSASLR